VLATLVAVATILLTTRALSPGEHTVTVTVTREPPPPAEPT